MTVIRSNSISGINSITAQSGALNFYTVGGNTLSIGASVSGNVTGNLTGNVNSSGVSTITTLSATSIVGVTTAGITTVYTNSFNGGQLGGSRNIIINGSMVVNQRGFTGAAGTTTNDSYPIDRFKLGHIHDGVVSAGQTTMNSTVGGNAYANGFNTALFFKVTTADASLGAPQFQVIRQLIEGYNVQGIKKGTTNAQPITLSFWVRSNTTGTYVVELEDVDNMRTCSQAYTINAANTWEKKTLTYPADTTGVFDNDNASSLFVNWWLAAGSNFTGGTLQTTWASTTQTNRAVGITNLLATAGNDLFLTGVQLEVGDRATEFERRSYGDELRLCQRYYETCYQQGLAPGSSTSQNNILAVCPGNINRGYGHLQFQVKKRASATVTFYSTSGAPGKFRNATQGTDITMSAACSFGDSGVSYETSVGIVGVTDRLQGLYTAEAEL